MNTNADQKAQKINDPHAEFAKPGDVSSDPGLTHKDKKKALENLEQDAHQLITASGEGMAPENESVTKDEPQLDDIARAQQRIGEKPQHKPAQ